MWSSQFHFWTSTSRPSNRGDPVRCWVVQGPPSLSQSVVTRQPGWTLVFQGCPKVPSLHTRPHPRLPSPSPPPMSLSLSTHPPLSPLLLLLPFTYLFLLPPRPFLLLTSFPTPPSPRDRRTSNPSGPRPSHRVYDGEVCAPSRTTGPRPSEDRIRSVSVNGEI